MAKIEKYKKVIFDNGKTLFINYAEPIGHSDKILRVSKDGEKWAIVNAETGEFVSDYKYFYELEIQYFKEGIRLFIKDTNGKWGALDENGKEIIPCEYDFYSFTSKNLVMVGNVKDGVMFYGAINYNGEVIIPVKYIEYCYQQESMFAWELQPIIPSYNGRRRLYGISNEWPVFLILLKDEEGNIGAYDTDGRIRIPFCKDKIIDFWGHDLI